MWWLCLIIAIVRTIRFLSALFDASLPKLSVAQATGAAWGGIKVSYAKLPMIYLTHSSVCYTWKIRSYQASSIRMYSRS
jgi:hypothetical protein